MIITYEEMEKRKIPLYDNAILGYLSGVPCWPNDDNGNAADCARENVLIGVLGDDGLFRAEEFSVFDPKHTMWVCKECLHQ